MTDDTDTDDLVDAGGIPALVADRARLAAIWTGFGAAALGCFGAVVVALAMWVPDAAATGTSGSTVRGGLLAFLAAQHGGLHLNGTPIGFVPLGLTAFAVYLTRRSAHVLWLLPSVGDVSRRRVLELVAWQIAAYATTTVAVSFFAVLGRSSAAPSAVAVGSIGVGLVGFGSVAAVADSGGSAVVDAVDRAGPGRRSRRPGLGRGLRRCGSAAGPGVDPAALRTVPELVAWDGRGLSGLPVAVGDLLAAPNAALAGTSYLAGPGFAIGHHATYAPFGGHGGLVPAFPVLAGLPVGEHASLTVLALMLMTVVVAGLVAGLIVHRELVADRWTAALLAAAGSGVGAGAVIGVLVALAGGSLGDHQLSAVGGSPGQVALAVSIEVAAVSLSTVVTARLFDHGVTAGDGEISVPIARLVVVAGDARWDSPAHDVQVQVDEAADQIGEANAS